jgi:hypothetical protein
MHRWRPMLIPPFRGFIAGLQEAGTDTYWLRELDPHDIVLAEDLPPGCYLETGNRGPYREQRRISWAEPVAQPFE